MVHSKTRVIAGLLVALLMTIMAASALAAPPRQGIGDDPPSSPPNYKEIAGVPLKIHVGDNASVQVYHTETGDSGAVYGTADSGFFLFIDGDDRPYSPDLENTNTTSAYGEASNAFALINQVGPNGSGSESDPFRIVTEQALNAANANLGVVQTVSYVNGDDYFRQDREITNNGSEQVCFSAYHAADIFFNGSDRGRGYYNADTGAVGGQGQKQDGSDWFMVFQPITPADHWQEGHFNDDIWSAVKSGTDLQDGIKDVEEAVSEEVVLEDAESEEREPEGPELHDNGIALQWDRCLEPGETTTISDYWSFGANVEAVIPPTDTPAPPTATPVPPTNTPVPPTNTPVPGVPDFGSGDACIELKVDPELLDAGSPLKIKAVIQAEGNRDRILEVTEASTVLTELPADTEVHFFMQKPGYANEFVSTPFARVASSSSWDGTSPCQASCELSRSSVTVDFPSSADGITSDVTVVETIEEGQAYVTGSLRVPPGGKAEFSTNNGNTWTTEEPASGVTNLRLTAGAVPGDATGGLPTELVPPLKEIDQTSGQDGFIPILAGDRIYALFHDQPADAKQLWCVERATSSVCEGYPKSVGQVATSLTPGGGEYFEDQNRLYFRLQSATQIGLMCWDSAANADCGFTPLADLEQGFLLGDRGWHNDRGTGPRRIGEKLYLVLDNHQVHCFDTTTNSMCPGYPKDSALVAQGIPPFQGGGNVHGGFMDMEVNGTRIYATIADPFDEGGLAGAGYLHCFDTATGMPCADWANVVEVRPPAGQEGGYWGVFFHKDPGGARDGVCLMPAIQGGGESRCFNFDGTANDAMLSSMDDRFTCGDCGLAQGPNRQVIGDGGWVFSFSWVMGETEVDDRTIFSGGFASQSQCWDWSTNAPCVGGVAGVGGADNYVGGVVDHAARLGRETFEYGAVNDNGCIISLGHNGVMHSWDPNTGDVCTISRGIATEKIAPSGFYCDGQENRNITWNDVRVVDADLTPGVEFNSFKITVVDADGNVVIAEQEMVGTSGSIDLSSIPYTTHQELSATLTFSAVPGDRGFVAWEDDVPPQVTLTFNADPHIQACYAVQQNTCEEEPPPEPPSEPPFEPPLFDKIPFCSYGDVHVRTPDGLGYNFQEFGEYILLQSTPAGDVMVQARLQPIRANPSVSINTALALKIGEDTIEFYQRPERHLLINGVETPLPTTEQALPNGGRLIVNPVDPAEDSRWRDFTFVWPDGSTAVRYRSKGNFHADIGVARLNNALDYEGLCGDLNNDPQNDMQVRNGALIDPENAGPEQLKTFGDSWRIPEGESLFSEAIPAADVVASNTVAPNARLFGVRVAEASDARAGVAQVSDTAGPTTLLELDPVARAEARQACLDAGVTDPFALDNCTFDFAVTQDGSYIESAASLEQAIQALPPSMAKETNIAAPSKSLAVGREYAVVNDTVPGTFQYFELVADDGDGLVSVRSCSGEAFEGVVSVNSLVSVDGALAQGLTPTNSPCSADSGNLISVPRMLLLLGLFTATVSGLLFGWLVMGRKS